MTSKEAVLELICEAKSVNIDERTVCFLRKIIEKDLDLLEEYRKIEEELGIDLITLFEALKKGIFVAYDSDFGMTNKPKIKITKDKATGICYRNKKWYIQEDETLIKDYGKTWALTRKELEND